jgi:hypothetical protein
MLFQLTAAIAEGIEISKLKVRGLDLRLFYNFFPPSFRRKSTTFDDQTPMNNVYRARIK